MSTADAPEAARRAALRSFLRARRARLTPATLGLPERANRRVRGLRREDVAEAAGVSLGWYARFELGRIAHVTDHLIDAIAAALRLDAAEHDYLRSLARATPTPPEPVDAAIPAPLRFIVESFTAGPAAIFGTRLNPLVVNDVARRLELGVSAAGATSDLAQSAFLDPAFPEKFVDWRERRRDVVAMLRSLYARYAGEPSYDAFIASMSERSAEFAQTWNAQEVQPVHFDGLRLRIGGETMLFRSVLLSSADAPGATVVFLVPSDPERFAALMARRYTP